ncbi:MAG: DUF4128 domain-containing protein [Candidatus Cloacimonetes bacterium]|nr:DUF4128 domain-containing protein [Candidatus Cloacimonadota bacterium]
MRYFTAIQQTLNSRLATLPNRPIWQRENLDLDPDETEIYIKSELIPAQTDYPNIGTNGFEIERGTFAVYVKAVRQTGWGPYSNLVDDILEHFPRNLELTSNADSGQEITIDIRRSYALNGFFDANGRYTIPIHIRYETYNLM